MDEAAAALRACLGGDLTFLLRAGAGTGGAAAIPAVSLFVPADRLPLSAGFFAEVGALGVMEDDYTIHAGL